MPRPTRHVSYESPNKQQPMPSPIRKMNRPRKPRDSDASSIISDDEPPSPPGSPFSPDDDERRPLPKSSKSKAAAQKDSLKKQAMHNRRSISGNYSQSQTVHHTPRQVSLRDSDDSSSIPSNLHVVGTALTPASKRPIPILSNFEDWLKLATDNKINATNSWNFALIDYFHEMSLLRDEGGKGINFQKASCTLDGCVKIYGARVESVGVEAGRLLSGLATTKDDDGGKKKRKGGEDGEDDDGSDAEGSGGEESDGEGGKKKKEKKRKARSHEATLAASFASLQLKKLELEFAVDPLFKKASADFDEGGAKGLLLNHLSINEEGRIVFDSSDDAADATKREERQASVEPEEEADSQVGENSQVTAEDNNNASEDPQQAQIPEDAEIDLNLLASKFLPDLAILDNLDICPSMKNFKLGDPTAALSIPLLQSDNNDWKAKNPSPEKQQAPPPQIDGELADQSGLFIDGSNGIDFDDDDGIGGFDAMGEAEVGFGQGGEAWAREAAVEPMLRPINGVDGDDADAENEDGYALAMAHRYQEDAEQEHMMDFFRKAVNSRAKVGSKAFTSITNWRIQRIQQKEQAENAPPEKRARKEKEPFKIDFYGPISDNLKKLLAEKPVPNEKISLPKTQLKTKGRNLLDKDDEVIDVKSMMKLWTKPKCRILRKKGGGMSLVDDGFGSKTRQQPMSHDKEGEDDDEDSGRGDYDANFFADDDPLGLPFYDGPLPIDDDDDDDQGGEQPGFVDAREMLSPPPDEQHAQQGFDDIIQQGDDRDQPPLGLELPTPSQQHEMLPGSFGSQLVTQQGRRLRPEYVNYARTAKKVDVRALKENMWKGMSSRLNIFPDPERIPTPELTDGDGDTDMADADAEPPESPPVPEMQLPQKEDEVLKFTDILGGLKSVYPETQMKDISTSYGFICLLHLANEKGLLLEGGRSEGLMEEILVRRDGTVGEGLAQISTAMYGLSLSKWTASLITCVSLGVLLLRLSAAIDVDVSSLLTCAGNCVVGEFDYPEDYDCGEDDGACMCLNSDEVGTNIGICCSQYCGTAQGGQDAITWLGEYCEWLSAVILSRYSKDTQNTSTLPSASIDGNQKIFSSQVTDPPQPYSDIFDESMFAADPQNSMRRYSMQSHTSFITNMSGSTAWTGQGITHHSTGQDPFQDQNPFMDTTMPMGSIVEPNYRPGPSESEKAFVGNGQSFGLGLEHGSAPVGFYTEAHQDHIHSQQDIMTPKAVNSAQYFEFERHNLMDETSKKPVYHDISDPYIANPILIPRRNTPAPADPPSSRKDLMDFQFENGEDKVSSPVAEDSSVSNPPGPVFIYEDPTPPPKPVVKSQCPLCESKFQTRKEFVAHMKAQHDRPVKFICRHTACRNPITGKSTYVTYRQSQYNKHHGKHHEDCQWVPRTDDGTLACQTLIPNPRPKRVWGCWLCVWIATDVESWVQHHMNEHRGSRPGDFSIPILIESLLQQDALKGIWQIELARWRAASFTVSPLSWADEPDNAYRDELVGELVTGYWKDQDFHLNHAARVSIVEALINAAKSHLASMVPSTVAADGHSSSSMRPRFCRQKSGAYGLTSRRCRPLN